jgi:serine protease Do
MAARPGLRLLRGASRRDRIQEIRMMKPPSVSRRRARNPRRLVVLAAAVALSVGGPGAVLADPPIATPQVKGMTSLADLAASVSDAVVNISASADEPEAVAHEMPDLPEGTPFDELFQQFFRHHMQQQGEGDDNDQELEPHSTSLGSGFVIDPSGIIITNNHVIEGANDITVIFTNGQKLKAQVVGHDDKVDVAVLRVKAAKPLKYVKFGDSDKMRVGDPVMAVGNPFGLGGTVTAGIVSARNRVIDNGPYDDYIQTDAAINKGNSGGPLFDMAGEVIGINTAILSPSGGSIGIGFATPAAEVMPVIGQLRKYGQARRGWLGVRVQEVDDEIADSLDLGSAHGALVAGVDDNGPAKPAGVKPGDVIVTFAGKPVDSSRDLPEIVASTPVGSEVDVVIVRDGKQQTLRVKLGQLKDDDQVASLTTGEGKGGPAAPGRTVVQKALGMQFAALGDGLRARYGIKAGLKGVVVTSVDPNSAASDKEIKPGELIVEINQSPVVNPQDVAAKTQALREEGRRAALLLVSTPQGDVRFVALPLD